MSKFITENTNETLNNHLQKTISEDFIAHIPQNI